ncbi:MAG TPA: hypothetical protein VGO58_19355 [Chitinophagaceae bacterium]|jgi:hypothetical protein|nr:hypothetical protein [Chitinophagaceae bacterium]
MKHNNYQVTGSLFIRLATLIALTIAYLCSGCEVLKTFRENKSDTASVKKSAVTVDNNSEGGAVRTEHNRSEEENEWFRVTMKYLTENKDGDTTINHFITQPATVIYEGGKTSRDEEKKLVDSTWYLNTMKLIALTVDSMSRKVDNYEKIKHSEANGLGITTIVLIGIGLIILKKLVGPG